MEPARLSEGEALSVLDGLLPALAEQASRRDAERVLPHAEIGRLSDAGLFALSVPERFGGADVSVETLTEVFRRLSTIDPSIGQIPQSHYVFLEALRLQGTPAQQARFFGEVVRGARYANAQTERGGRTITEYATTLTPDGPGQYRLNGQKFYATGSLFADRLLVRAVLPDGPAAKAIAFVPADASGVTIEDDWNAMGQRTTGSGTVRLENVLVPEDDVVPFTPIFDQPTHYGAFAQLLHAAIDAGIARAALTEAAAFVTTRSRPYPDAGVDRAADDPLIVHAFGQLELQVRAAEAVLAEAGRAVDRAEADLTAHTAGRASLAVAAARALTTAASLDAGNRLFEVAGTRSALARLGLDRHWRNARTHTLHDPAAWKIQHLGRYAIDGTLPPNHGQL